MIVILQKTYIVTAHRQYPVRRITEREVNNNLISASDYLL